MNEHRKPIIDLKDIKNVLGGQTVHEHLNLTIDQGEIMAIIGGSGSGKTTLLRNMLMLLRPTAGSISIFGIDILGRDFVAIQEVRHRWGVLFQHGALFSGLTVLENVQFPLRTFTNLPPKAQEEIAMLKIVMVGLPPDAASKYPSELSGGMQKRAALARAIAMDPELLFLDEPTSGLDPQSAGTFDELILDLREALGLTVIMVTHDMDSLAQITDRVAFLAEKTVLAALPLEELVQQKHAAIQNYFAGRRGKRTRKAVA